jgi:hypothetical protein
MQSGKFSSETDRSVSSANRLIVEWSIAVKMSLIYDTKKSELRTELWGTSSSAFLIADKTALNPVF